MNVQTNQNQSGKFSHSFAEIEHFESCRKSILKNNNGKYHEMRQQIETL